MCVNNASCILCQMFYSFFHDEDPHGGAPVEYYYRILPHKGAGRSSKVTSDILET